MIRLNRGRIVVSRVVNGPAEEIWRVLTDTRLWPCWGPSVAAVQCPDRFIGAGSTGTIRTSFGLALPFTITDYRDRAYWSWRVGRVEATGHRLEPLADGKCSVSFDLPWWALPYAAVCLIALRRIAAMIVPAGERC